MNVLAIHSSGNKTSLCIIFKDDILEYSVKHERKDRPNWSDMLDNIGLNSFFTMDAIDIFAYANSSGSYTATRSVAAYLKGVSSALQKPLLVIDSENIDDVSSDMVAKEALKDFMESQGENNAFNPEDANPIYISDPQYKKINE